MSKNKKVEEIPFFYVTPEQYSKQTGIWIQEVKRKCRIGEIECVMSDGGHYNIKVYRNGYVPKEEHEKTIRELEKYKTIVETFYNAAQILQLNS